jgi:hypothetical protein
MEDMDGNNEEEEEEEVLDAVQQYLFDCRQCLICGKNKLKVCRWVNNFRYENADGYCTKCFNNIKIKLLNFPHYGHNNYRWINPAGHHIFTDAECREHGIGTYYYGPRSIWDPIDISDEQRKFMDDRIDEYLKEYNHEKSKNK